MSNASLLLIFANVTALWTMAIIVPGMDFLMVLRTALMQGRVAALKVSCGITIAIGLWGLAGFFGIHTLFEASPLLYTLLKISGGLYLCYLGVQLLRQGMTKHPAPLHNTNDSPQTKQHSFRTGMLTNLANPKAPIFTSSLFATSIPAHTPLYAGLSCVGLMMGLSLLWFSGVALLLSQRPVAAQFQRFRHWIDRLSGATLFILGGHFITSRSS
ncbi:MULTISPECIES: LysE family translocator [unclassified Saccharibacter]|uniref:LysE family translocator n=1 Tax=unclassified Saccharibacter TaxID=2648722 RepID=UPI001329BDB8|nr:MULTISPECIES: LysE family transporter [unclassified Saccharibacter]MXV35161.1 LysE family transporter [Saccharibacter sp. EH611]MXV57292.1 LysE family transporter [Saccharibacter sp. EH70]MXV64847.1 LysE family transporter [Saccharibacter sp. EH60]